MIRYAAGFLLNPMLDVVFSKRNNNKSPWLAKPLNSCYTRPAGVDKIRGTSDASVKCGVSSSKPRSCYQFLCRRRTRALNCKVWGRPTHHSTSSPDLNFPVAHLQILLHNMTGQDNPWYCQDVGEFLHMCCIRIIWASVWMWDLLWGSGTWADTTTGQTLDIFKSRGTRGPEIGMAWIRKVICHMASQRKGRKGRDLRIAWPCPIWCFLSWWG